VGLHRANRYWAIHSDHLATPRLMRDDRATPVWQWPYSAFGDNQPIGALRATAKPRQAFTQEGVPPELLRATSPQAKLNLRYPGQYFDEESKLSYNYFRSYDAATGRYTQSDPIGLEGGLNRFGYVDQNALWASDPQGLRGRGGAIVGSRGEPSIGAFGCMGLACISGNTRDDGAQMSVELTFGSGIEICDPPPPPPPNNSCLRPSVSVQPPGVPVPRRLGGLFVSPSVRSDGRVCIRLGVFGSPPIPLPSIDLGGMGSR
jgi:RHS repeat-associated protein